MRPPEDNTDDHIDPDQQDAAPAQPDEHDDSVDKHMRVLVSGSVLIGVGNGLQKVLLFALGIVLARGLGRTDFGTFSIAQSISRLGMFTFMGLRGAVLKFTAHFHALGDRARRAGVVKGMAMIVAAGTLLVAGAVIIAAPYLSARVYHNPDLTLPLQMMMVEVPLMGMRSNYLAALQAVHELTPLVAIRSVGAPVGQVIGVALTTRAEAPLSVTAAVFPAISFMAIIASVLWYRRRFARNGATESVIIPWRDLLVFAAPMSLIGVLGMERASIDILVLGGIFPPDQLGVYSAAAQMASLVVFPAVAICTVFAPTISTFYAREDTSGLRTTLVSAVGLATFAAMAMAGVVYCLRAPLMQVFGAGFATGQTVLVLIALARLFNAASQPLLTLFQMANRPWVAVLDNAMMAGVMCVSLLLVGPHFGLTGAGLVMAATMTTLASLRSWRTWKIYQIAPYDRRTGRLWPLFAIGVILAVLADTFVSGYLGTALALLGFFVPMAFAGKTLIPILMAHRRRDTSQRGDLQ